MLYGDLKWSEVAQSCQTLCDPMDCSPPGFSIHGILQARILDWVTISFSRGSSRPRDRTHVSHVGSRCFTLWKGNPRKRVLYVCMWLIHFAVQEKQNIVKQLYSNKKKNLSSEFHMAYIVTFIRLFSDTIFFFFKLRPQLLLCLGFPGGSAVKNPPAAQERQETRVPSLGQDVPLEEGMATHSTILAWKIPRTEESGGLQPIGSQRVRHDWAWALLYL